MYLLRRGVGAVTARKNGAAIEFEDKIGSLHFCRLNWDGQGGPVYEAQNVKLRLW